MNLETPCQAVVWDILPAIRAALAMELVKNGISQKEVAKMFGMAPSAVSQYLTKKRGYRIEFDDDVKESIARLALEIQEGKVDNVPAKICEICRYLRRGEGACPVED
ncbi:helix-turn-helix domain-containing protein [Methanococcoides orientis]|uniref:transcriptional regulator n=1 Tax=Methanococcoides orientis TaxID=2822137 RepID=UPI001E62C090|nr:helix-turn-helix domain-containing protein [Methanococcoides orientis]UGV41180.1 helix-turn-helix domain-containing protein [Methanococcoides orientis]